MALPYAFVVHLEKTTHTSKKLNQIVKLYRPFIEILCSPVDGCVNRSTCTESSPTSSSDGILSSANKTNYCCNNMFSMEPNNMV